MNLDPQQLFSRYADGTITQEELLELENRLSADESLRKEFLDYMNVCVALEEQAAYPFFDQPETCFEPKTVSFLNLWRKRILYGSLVAAASIALALFSFFTRAPLNHIEVPAIVLRNDSALMNGGTTTFPVGEHVLLSEIDLRSGWLRLELPKGVVFDIYGPAKGRFDATERFRLDSGRLNVDVGALGKGFTVTTECADIVDLGTSFGVEVGENSLSKVAVFSGEVEVHAREAQKSPQLLAEGEGIQVESTGAASRLMSINIANENSSKHRLSARDNAFDIRDNLNSYQSLRYYGIVGNGMIEGAHAYTTQKRVRWAADADKPFPSELVGADLIQTFHNFRVEEDLEIALNLRQPSIVYVLFDERYETPDWLLKSFVNTGHIVRSGPWRPVGLVHDIIPDSHGNFFIRYQVWKTEVESDQTLTLGESRSRVMSDFQRAMYGIAVRPLDSATNSVANNRSRNLITEPKS